MYQQLNGAKIEASGDQESAYHAGIVSIPCSSLSNTPSKAL
jgi:hypothetical protein